jgi:hypothetical protein
MPIYVKDGGTFREISSDAGTQVYVRDGTSFTNKTITNAYVKDGGSWRTVFTLFDTPASFSTATGSVAVPANANAIHFQFAVGGGSGGVGGASYDKAGGESAGAGGSSGAYISDKVFTVTGGETLTVTAGAGGAASGNGYNDNCWPVEVLHQLQVQVQVLFFLWLAVQEVRLLVAVCKDLLRNNLLVLEEQQQFQVQF